MNIELVLGSKYRVVKGDYTVVGILTNIELGDTSCIELTYGGDVWDGSYKAEIYGPWDLIEQEIK